MRRNLAIELVRQANKVAHIWTNRKPRPNRPGEVFRPIKVIPLSEAAAIVYFHKSPSNKIGYAFFYFINWNGDFKRGEWRFFFPTESHVFAMQKIARYHAIVERKNFGENFEGAKNAD